MVELGKLNLESSGDVSDSENGEQQEDPISEQGGADTHSDQSGADTYSDNSLSNYQLARDRVRRENIKRPTRYSEADVVYYALCAAENLECADPLSFKEAMMSRDRERWIEAMNEEMDSLLKNKTWILVDKSNLKQESKDKKLISCKWIFKKNIETTDKDGIKFKARLVARGFT